MFLGKKMYLIRIHSILSLQITQPNFYWTNKWGHICLHEDNTSENDQTKFFFDVIVLNSTRRILVFFLVLENLFWEKVSGSILEYYRIFRDVTWKNISLLTNSLTEVSRLLYSLLTETRCLSNHLPSHKTLTML